MSTGIRSFRVDVPAADLVDLARRLEQTRWPDQPVAPTGATAFQSTTPGTAFHVVVPSIPCFGFSGVTREVGWTTARVARAWAELMRRLGYERYVAHGGALGSLISRELAVIDPQHVIGLHLNHVFSASIRPGEADDSVEEQRRSAEASHRYQHELDGYAVVQGTRPQSIAYGLTDSPVAQLAWIAERFKDRTDSAEVPEDAVDRDALPTNVMLYWLTGTGGSVGRYYKDGSSSRGERDRYSPVPTAVAVSPRDIVVPVGSIAAATYNIVRWTEFDRGGTSRRWRYPSCWSPICGRCTPPPSSCGVTSTEPRAVDSSDRAGR